MIENYIEVNIILATYVYTNDILAAKIEIILKKKVTWPAWSVTIPVALQLQFISRNSRKIRSCIVQR